MQHQNQGHNFRVSLVTFTTSYPPNSLPPLLTDLDKSDGISPISRSFCPGAQGLWRGSLYD